MCVRMCVFVYMCVCVCVCVYVCTFVCVVCERERESINLHRITMVVTPYALQASLEATHPLHAHKGRVKMLDSTGDLQECK